MPQKVIQAAQALVNRAKKRGSTIPEGEFDALAVDLAILIPAWFRQLFTTLPLCGMDLGWQAYDPDGDNDGTARMEWADARGIQSESLLFYPGCAIREFGYINVAGDLMGGGDPYFINIHEGDDPPLYQIYRDVSDQGAVIIAKARRIVSPTLSEFFLSGAIK